VTHSGPGPGPDPLPDPEQNPAPDPEPPTGLSRSAGKRQAISEAATRIFLEQGFGNSSMDEIAAAAGVSKQTVYKQFTDKKQLLYEIVLGITGRAGQIATTITELLGQIDDINDVEPGLTVLARRYAAAVLSPAVLQLRRLIVSEATRFPDLAQAYFEQAPGRGLEAVAAGLQQLAQRDLLQIEDGLEAANHFAYLVLGPLIDKAMFFPDEPLDVATIEQCADAGVKVFLAAYGIAPAGDRSIPSNGT
jgi:TetR/AcrR family transcriptional regulator, mexJK operon transcriptional repressor